MQSFPEPHTVLIFNGVRLLFEIRTCLCIFPFCSDKFFPAFGFGAKLPPDFQVGVSVNQRPSAHLSSLHVHHAGKCWIISDWLVFWTVLLFVLQAAHHEFALNFNPTNPHCQGTVDEMHDDTFSSQLNYIKIIVFVFLRNREAICVVHIKKK